MNLFERFVALILFLIFIPVMAIISLAVFLTDPSAPIIYSGIRIGKYGRRFIMYKFRTLKMNAEAIIGSGLLTDSLCLKTPVGRILRQLKLDELPQLVNIIKGEMSFIGPRPVRPVRFYENVKNIAGYEERFTVLPGLSGVAQIEAGYYTSPEEKLIWDLYWINKQDSLTYLKYFFNTLFMVGAKFASRVLMPVSKAMPWIGILIFLLKIPVV